MKLYSIEQKKKEKVEGLGGKYIHFLKREGKSKNTIESYSRSVRKYNDWFEKKYGNQPSKLFRENFNEYKEYLQKRKLSPKTFNLHLTGLASFNQFLIKEKVQSEIVITKKDFKKIQKTIASPCRFEKDEIMRFVQCVLEIGNMRDYCLVNLLIYSGLRITEALSLTLDCVRLETRELVVRDGKGNKSRTVLIGDKLARVLNDYLVNIRPTYNLCQQSEFLFVSNKSPQLSRMSENKAFRKYNRLASVSDLTPHDCRHFFVTNLLKNGFDVHEVANMAGHSNVQTTLIYSNPSRKKMLEKLNSL
ncbi:tyrosine-type recombinase/integrase [Bacillus sp. AFS040349]|uniref:tyrosine-type recombinase/integrase n=1 Tax=Bacillus sp. AFS040349 TaxID=2033502 RepID=UPI000BFB50FF|nr:tyrosine-type recombinase/integrase [Bacillus sp. AFS040349]PGT80518.1 transposase [Bacillus sp. AFS040349]